MKHDEGIIKKVDGYLPFFTFPVSQRIINAVKSISMSY